LLRNRRPDFVCPRPSDKAWLIDGFVPSCGAGGLNRIGEIRSGHPPGATNKVLGPATNRFEQFILVIRYRRDSQ
jgi:hypothetical protein